MPSTGCGRTTSCRSAWPCGCTEPLRRIVEAVDGGVVVHVHVLPRSGRTEIVGRHGDALKVRVTAAPVDGQATEAARVAVAAALGVSASAVTVVGGERSRMKRLRVAGLDAAAANLRLAPYLDGGRGPAPG